MRIENNHAHADTRYKLLGLIDFVRLWKNTVEAKQRGFLSLTVHLPFEIQHYQRYGRIWVGYLFVYWGELLKKVLGVKLYWENAPEENYGVWNLKSGQTLWEKVPKNIDLCFDTGHFLIGKASIEAARAEILDFLDIRSSQVKHLHLHVNDLKTDQHKNDEEDIRKILSDEVVNKLMKSRSYIFEKGE